ncbi:LysM peptidoglycan-binding domain-containing M23 family metallopeptidase [Patescibacteria group bacterium]|nr:LysM peptidoglycan-binding domain-containing M23 family metallopeptidase [Patescibacteria group bacterium]
MTNTTNNEEGSIPLPSPKANSFFSLFSKLFQGKKQGRGAKTEYDKPLHRAYLYLGKRPFWGYHVFFLFLITLVGTSTSLAKTRLEQSILQNSESVGNEAKAVLAASVDRFTPVVQEDPTSLILATKTDNNEGYYSEPLITETKLTERPAPEPKVDLTKRSRSIVYTVEPGDTLSTIGLKYGLRVATIQYQNNIKSENIVPGQKLTLPPGDISASLIAQNNNKKIADARYFGAQTSGTTGFVKPMNYSYISRRILAGHNGTDMVAPRGTAVVSAKSGVVTGASYGWNGGYGNIVTIDHGGGVRTRYAHLDSIAVSAGQSVSAGQYIGACGNTGRVISFGGGGYHLHFEAIVNGRYTAPF